MPTERLLEDAQSYALLTEDVGSRRTSRPSPSGGSTSSGTSLLGQIVDGALREVLGWRPRSTDANGFVAALNQSFSIKDVEGHTEWKWTPRTYAVAAEIGAVTGAQASIYTRAKAMLDQSLPLLEGLYPLNAAFDDEDAEASRAIVKSNLSELVAELGREGGPRVARVDELFDQLLDTDDADLLDTESLDGQMGLLRERFGLERKFVNTIGEEQNLTNYLILADNTISLLRTWEQLKKFFELGANDVFLGTQLVLLSRALAVVAESVEETYFIMDSVFLGSAERQVSKLDFVGNGLSSIFLGDLLSWIEGFASDEGPRLIRDGGKDGVIKAFSKSAAKLFELTDATANLSDSDQSDLPPSFHTARVRRSLRELANQLEKVSDLANQITREPQSEPVVSAVIPDAVAIPRLESSGQFLVRLTVLGEDFQDGPPPMVNLLGPNSTDPPNRHPATKVTVANEYAIVATFDLATALPGLYSIKVTNGDDGTATCKECFEIKTDLNIEPPEEMSASSGVEPGNTPSKPAGKSKS